MQYRYPSSISVLDNQVRVLSIKYAQTRELPSLHSYRGISPPLRYRYSTLKSCTLRSSVSELHPRITPNSFCVQFAPKRLRLVPILSRHVNKPQMLKSHRPLNTRDTTPVAT
uniref:Uncharacterized protein n=1 Tax=Ananas comosus var. bracteatus TaxID=296719 RepID=A0A6V7NPD7_ANACO|nr:unnamed protein product [Ananas comosus var. bracteatus]